MSAEQNFTHRVDGDGVLRVVFDTPGQKVNLLTEETLKGLDRLLEGIALIALDLDAGIPALPGQTTWRISASIPQKVGGSVNRHDHPDGVYRLLRRSPI